jgi:hypothetical protein
MKTLNTQLASWTELRHNTVLYTEQSYTPLILCLYPKGYVEPRPSFWSRVREMASATHEILATLSTNGVFSYSHYTNDSLGIPVEFVVTVSGATMYSKRLAVMDQFVSTMETLRSISEKELNMTSLSDAETQFIQHLVEFDYLGRRSYTGWYPRLFYEPGSEYLPPNSQTDPTGDNKGSDYPDPLVTDVHTDPTDIIAGDPGSILHEGVGNVHLMMISIDCGPGDRAVYAGPVLSHYEFEVGPTTRLTDAEWKSMARPPAPEWTRGYLVPSP